MSGNIIETSLDTKPEGTPFQGCKGTWSNPHTDEYEAIVRKFC